MIKTCSCEDFPCCGHGETELEGELARESMMEREEMGWPGSGDGTDDFADYNANEADDYRNEGADDHYEPMDDGLYGDDGDNDFGNFE